MSKPKIVLLSIALTVLALTTLTTYSAEPPTGSKAAAPQSNKDKRQGTSSCEMRAGLGCNACSVTCPVGNTAVCRPGKVSGGGGLPITCDRQPSCTCKST